MHTSASLRWSTVVLAILLAACGPGGSPGPSSSGSSPTAPASPAASLVATAAPSAAAVILPVCSDPYALPGLADVQFRTMRDSPFASLQHIVATSTGPLGFTTRLGGPGQYESEPIGRLAGNRDVSFSVIPGVGGPAVLTAIVGSLQIGTAAAVQLASSVTGYSPRVTIPDVAGEATMTLALAWSDGCFTYTGDVVVHAIVELGATVAACPTAETGIRTLAGQVKQVEFQAGHVPALLAGESWSSKFLDLDGGEPAPQFSGLDVRQVPVSARAGTSITVSENAMDLQITAVDAAFFRYDDVMPNPYDVSPDPVFNSTGVVRADETVGVQLPNTPGKYVVTLYISWDAPCLTGSGMQTLFVTST